MPYSDAVQYLHGSGSSSGPLTSTAKTLTGVSQSGTTLTYTVATGQLMVGDTVVLAGGGYTTQNVVVLAILTGAGLTGTAIVHVSQTVTTTTATAYPNLIGDAFIFGTTNYSNLELDFGAPNPGISYPWLPQFPSSVEKAYTFPPEVVGQGGTEFGVHLLVTAPFNTFATVTFSVLSAATADPVIGTAANIIASRPFSLAQFQVQGAHYFIPVPGSAVLEFLRWYAALTSGSANTAGALVSWWGPRTGGEQ